MLRRLIARLRACLPGLGPGTHRGRWSTSLTGLESHPESHVARGVRRPRRQYRDNNLGGSKDLCAVSLARTIVAERRVGGVEIVGTLFASEPRTPGAAQGCSEDDPKLREAARTVYS